MISRQVVLLALLGAWVHEVAAHSTGAVAGQSCGAYTLASSHNPTTYATTGATITVTDANGNPVTSYALGSTYTVTATSTSGAFLGYLLGTTNGAYAVSANAPNSKTVACPTGTWLTQGMTASVSTISAQWTPTATTTAPGTVTLGAALVQNLASAILVQVNLAAAPTTPTTTTTTLKGQTTVATKPTTTVTTTTLSTTSTTSAPAGGSAVSGTSVALGGNVVQLSWVADATKATFTVSYMGTGWLSIGLVPALGDKAHQGITDAWVATFNPTTGTGSVIDSYQSAASYTTPPPDTTQGGTNDITLISASQTGGVTKYVFSRPLVTADANDLPISNNMQQFLFAFNAASSDTSPTGVHLIPSGYGYFQANLMAVGGAVAVPTTSAAAGAVTGANNAGAGGSSFTSLGEAALKLAWAIDATKTMVTFTLTYTKTGWLAVGLSNAGKGHVMMDSFFALYDPVAGKGTITDCYQVSGTLSPPLDTAQGGKNDYTLISSSLANGVTTWVFTRLLVTNDANDIAFTNTPQSFLYAYNPTSTDTIGGIHALPTGGTPNGYGYFTANLFSNAAVVAPTIVQYLDPGQVLNYIVLSIFGLYLVGRVVRKVLKALGLLKNPAGKGSGLAARNSKEADVERSVIPMAVEIKGIPEPTADSSWEEHFTEDGTPYYWNSMTDESVWDMPAAMRNKKLSRRSIIPSIKRGLQAGGSDSSDGFLNPTRASAVNPNNLNYRLSVAPTRYRGSERYTAARNGDQFNGTEDVSLKSNDSSALGFFKRRVFGLEFTWGDALIAAIYVVLNVLVLIFAAPPMSYTSKLGYILGPNSLYVTLPATRNSILRWLFGLPFDRTVMFHRWLGRWVIFLGTLHYIVPSITWWPKIIENTIISEKYELGLVSWVALVLVLVTSIGFFRRRHFNFFLISHFIFVVYFIFGTFHSQFFAPYAVASLGFYFLDRLFRLFGSNSMQITQDFTVLDHSVTRVRINKSWLSRNFSHYQVGQYVFLNFPAVDLLEWHPFTISSAPSDSCVEVHIKALGDHTNKLLKHAEIFSSTTVRVDGPYGNYKLNYLRYGHIVLVSGGIGVTPAMAMVSEIYRTRGDFKYAQPLPPHGIRTVHFVWVIRELSTVEIFLKTLTDSKESSKKKGKPALFVHIYVTGKMEGSVKPAFSSPFIKNGRPVWNDILKDVPDNSRPGILFACGPAKLVTESSEVIYNFSSTNNQRWDFHHEVFDF